MSIVLRPYQNDLDALVQIAWLDPQVRNILAVLPTGAGKTVVLARIVARETGAVVILAHRAELIAQLSLALAKEGVRHNIYGRSSTIKMCVQSHVEVLLRSFYDPNARVTVGSVQTVAKMAQDFPQVTLWVQDEAHHVVNDNQFGRVLAKFPNARGLGVTATPLRLDGKGLGRHASGVFDRMLVGPTMRELIRAGFLSDYRVFTPPTNFNRKAIRKTASGELDHKEVQAETKRSRVLGDVVEHYVKNANDLLGLTFADSLDSAADIAQNYRDAGVPAEVLSGKTDDTVRAAVLRKFRNRQVMQIVSVALIDEGFDCPAVEVVSDVAPTESFGRFAQRFGRGLRVMEGKTHMRYFDHVGNIDRHGLPDRVRDWTLDGRTRAAAVRDDTIPLRVCAGCTAVYERIHKACPYCGFVPEILVRSRPEQVDGDLTELDPAALAAMRGEVDAADCTPLVYSDKGHFIVAQHRARNEAQEALRAAMNRWGGWQDAQGRSESEGMRRFYFRFGVDVMSARLLGAADARKLYEAINDELTKERVYESQG